MGVRGNQYPWMATTLGRHDKGKDPLLQAKQAGGNHRGCCKSEEHKSVDYDKTKRVADRRKYLSDNKLC